MRSGLNGFVINCFVIHCLVGFSCAVYLLVSNGLREATDGDGGATGSAAGTDNCPAVARSSAYCAES